MDSGIAGFAFDRGHQGDEALVVANGIDLPVAGFLPVVDGLGAVLDRNSLGDVQFFMSAVMSFAPAFAVMTRQKRKMRVAHVGEPPATVNRKLYA